MSQRFFHGPLSSLVFLGIGMGFVEPTLVSAQDVSTPTGSAQDGLEASTGNTADGAPDMAESAFAEGATSLPKEAATGDASAYGGLLASPLSPPVGGRVPNSYTVVNGDTLWAISGRFWGDTYFWPTLWSYNPRIGNAHLIYPGNVLRFTLGSPVRPPGMTMGYEEPTLVPQAEVEYSVVAGEYVEVATSNAMECRPPIPFADEPPGTNINSRMYGFFDEAKKKPIGRIIRSPLEKQYLGQRDIVYVKFSQLSEVQCGDVYTIYRPLIEKVRTPKRRFGKLGSVHTVTGEVRILDIGESVATAEILTSYSEVFRGDFISDFIPVKKEVQVRASTKEVDGQIVASLAMNDSSLSHRDVVFIDLGEADGLAEGDAFYVTREGDGLEMYRRRSDSLPTSVVGKLVIVELGESMSAAIITESARSLNVGDNISMQLF